MKQIDYERTGRLLRNYRELHQMSLREAASKVYISHDILFRYEKATRKPSLENMILLADLYGKNVEDLIVFTNDRKETE